MSFWGRLFGSSDATREIISMVRDAGDALVYTKEERAEYAAEERREAHAVMLEWIKNSQGQNLSRRFLTIVITSVWLLFLITSVFVSIAGIWIDQEQAKIAETYTKLNEIVSGMEPIIMLIIGFYFSSPYLNKFSQAAIAKFEGKSNGQSGIDKKPN